MKQTAVYVSNLPPSATPSDLHAFFSRAGIIMDDMHTGEPRIKLYGKGDALVVYLREESVQLAVSLFDEVDFNGSVIRVEPAVFDNADSDDKIDINTHSKTRVDKETWKRKMAKMTSKLEWEDETETAIRSVQKQLKFECTCLLYNMITMAEIEADAGLLIDVEEDVREEASKLGKVLKVSVLPSHECVAVRFDNRESAVVCQQLMNQRYYNGRCISARLYDGSFKLKPPSDSTTTMETQNESNSDLE